MTKLLEALILIVALCLGLAWLAVPDAQADEPQTITQNLRDEFACPGMHAEWLDEKTVHCLKERP
ncbi:hypothetical protein [Comamonas testosteroni]|uniref:hypothetical protein n=1 Tax=Comamonas testosteroni TaxID=285 RepID=UPI0026F0CCBF|nr:hypothetical protein [Comamonas testosteroni]WQD44840.1 hypothetical protein U0024_08785 [Comamonas testosteroni]